MDSPGCDSVFVEVQRVKKIFAIGARLDLLVKDKGNQHNCCFPLFCIVFMCGIMKL